MQSNRLVSYSLLIAAIGLASTAIAARAGGALVDGQIGPGAAPASASAPRTEASEPLLAPLSWLPAPSTEIPGEAEAKAAGRDGLALVANDQIIAFYGNPLSRRMGILGEYPKEELARLLSGYARLYDEANGSSGVAPAFYLVFGTCWPAGEIGYLPGSLVREYIEFAASAGILVFIDHQIGKYTIPEAVASLLPWLSYPNVHLALDPEWRTLSPMEEIGSVRAEEINEAQAMIDDYLRSEGIAGSRILVVHQFTGKMISGRDRVRSDYPRVTLIHTADGFGPPGIKRLAYASNAKASNMPLKGFKLFLRTDVEGAGFDEPLLTPPEVLALEPRPELVIYQ